MPSIRRQIQEQSLEIDELKQQRQELRRLNALLEGDPAVVKWKGKIRKANEEALIAKEELDTKQEELDGKEKELEEKQEEVEALKAEHEEEMGELKAKLKHEKEMAELKKKALEVELEYEKDMAKFYRDQVDVKNAQYLNESIMARQMIENWKQKAAELNQQLAAAIQQATSANDQTMQMQLEVLRLQEIISTHMCIPVVQNESEVEAQLRRAKVEVKDYQKGIEVLREMLRTTEAEHDETRQATERRHSEVVKSLQEKHAQEVEELNTELECTYEQLRLARERRSRSSGDCERTSKRKLDAAISTSASGGRRTRTKIDKPLSDLNLTQ